MSRLWFKYDPAFTKIFSYKKRNYCKGVATESETIQEEPEDQIIDKTYSQPPGLQKQKPTKTIDTITGEIVRLYIEENLGIVTTSLRNASYENSKKTNECEDIIE